MRDDVARVEFDLQFVPRLANLRAPPDPGDRHRITIPRYGVFRVSAWPVGTHDFRYAESGPGAAGVPPMRWELRSAPSIQSGLRMPQIPSVVGAMSTWLESTGWRPFFQGA